MFYNNRCEKNVQVDVLNDRVLRAEQDRAEAAERAFANLKSLMGTGGTDELARRLDDAQKSLGEKEQLLHAVQERNKQLLFANAHSNGATDALRSKLHAFEAHAATPSAVLLFRVALRYACRQRRDTQREWRHLSETLTRLWDLAGVDESSSSPAPDVTPPGLEGVGSLVEDAGGGAAALFPVRALFAPPSMSSSPLDTAMATDGTTTTTTKIGGSGPDPSALDGSDSSSSPFARGGGGTHPHPSPSGLMTVSSVVHRHTALAMLLMQRLSRLGGKHPHPAAAATTGSVVGRARRRSVTAASVVSGAVGGSASPVGSAVADAPTKAAAPTSLPPLRRSSGAQRSDVGAPPNPSKESVPAVGNPSKVATAGKVGTSSRRGSSNGSGPLAAGGGGKQPSQLPSVARRPSEGNAPPSSSVQSESPSHPTAADRSGGGGSISQSVVTPFAERGGGAKA